MVDLDLSEIKRHWIKAIQKHPKFADCIIRNEALNGINYKNVAEDRKKQCKRKGVDAVDIFDAEWAEVFDAYQRGDLNDAIDEIYDCIAVLCRMVKMMKLEIEKDCKK